MRQVITQEFEKRRKILHDLSTPEILSVIEELADKFIECWEAGGKVLLMGNGGSAANAQHVAGDIVGRFKRERRGLPGVALTTDTSIITAVGNDYGYDQVFARQVEGIGTDKDILISFSSSGNSANLIEAIKKAKEMGMYTVSFSAKGGGNVTEFADWKLVLDADMSDTAEEAQLILGHLVCQVAEEKVYTGSTKF